MSTVADLTIMMGLNTVDFDRGMASVTRGLAGFGRSLTGFGIAAGGAAIGAALGAAAHQAAEFGHAISEIQTVMPAGTKDIDGMTRALKELAVQHGKGPQEEASALYEIYSAGVTDTARAMDILTTANKLAVGGVTDVHTAADGLTSVMGAYGSSVKDATEVADAFFIAARDGKTRVEELASSIGNVAPLAAQTGVALDDLLAATSTLTTGGLSTSQAMVGIRQTIAAVLQPTKQAREEAQALGLEFNGAALRAKGLSGFLTDVAAKTHGSAEAQAILFGNIRALNAVMGLAGNEAGKYAETLADMGNKAGAAAAANKLIEETSPAFVFSQLSAAAKVAAIDMGESINTVLLPAARALRDHMDDIAPAIKTLIDLIAVGGLILALTNLAAIMETVAGTALGSVMVTLATDIAAASTAGLGFVGTMEAIGLSITSALGVLIGPAALITGIYLLGKAFFDNNKHMEEHKNLVDQLSHAYETLDRKQIDASISAYAYAIAAQKQKLQDYEKEHPIATAIGFYSEERLRLKKSIEDMQGEKEALANAWLQAPLSHPAPPPPPPPTTPGNVIIVPPPGTSNKQIKLATPLITQAQILAGDTIGRTYSKELGSIDYASLGLGGKMKNISQEIPPMFSPKMQAQMDAIAASTARAVARMDSFNNALGGAARSLTDMGLAFLQSKGWFGQYGKASGAGGNLGAMLGGGLVNDLIGKGAIGGTVGKLLNGKVIGGLLGSVLPGLGTIAGGLIGSLGGSLVGKVGGFIGGLFGRHKKPVDDSAKALEELAKQTREVTEALTNVPTIFKTALARHESADPLDITNGGSDPDPNSPTAPWGNGGPAFDPNPPLGTIIIHASIDATDRSISDVYDELVAYGRHRGLARSGKTDGATLVMN